MKKEYISPSFEKIKFRTQKVMLDNSDIFHDEDDAVDGDVTIIKPFG